MCPALNNNQDMRKLVRVQSLYVRHTFSVLTCFFLPFVALRVAEVYECGTVVKGGDIENFFPLQYFLTTMPGFTKHVIYRFPPNGL